MPYSPCTCGMASQTEMVALPRHHAPDCPVRQQWEAEQADPRERFAERGEADPRRSFKRGRRAKPEDLGRG